MRQKAVVRLARDEARHDQRRRDRFHGRDTGTERTRSVRRRAGRGDGGAGCRAVTIILWVSTLAQPPAGYLDELSQQDRDREQAQDQTLHNEEPSLRG